VRDSRCRSGIAVAIAGDGTTTIVCRAAAVRTLAPHAGARPREVQDMATLLQDPSAQRLTSDFRARLFSPADAGYER
jgi:hypothetical protein